MTPTTTRVTDKVGGCEITDSYRLIVDYRALKDFCECMSRCAFVRAFAAEEGCCPVW